MKSNEVIRVKRMIHKLISDKEALILNIGIVFFFVYLIASIVTAIIGKPILSILFLIGIVAIWFGSYFLLKEYELEDNIETEWLHEDWD